MNPYQDPDPNNSCNKLIRHNQAISNNIKSIWIINQHMIRLEIKRIYFIIRRRSKCSNINNYYKHSNKMLRKRYRIRKISRNYWSKSRRNWKFKRNMKGWSVRINRLFRLIARRRNSHFGQQWSKTIWFNHQNSNIRSQIKMRDRRQGIIIWSRGWKQ